MFALGTHTGSAAACETVPGLGYPIGRVSGVSSESGVDGFIDSASQISKVADRWLQSPTKEAEKLISFGDRKMF